MNKQPKPDPALPYRAQKRPGRANEWFIVNAMSGNVGGFTGTRRQADAEVLRLENERRAGTIQAALSVPDDTLTQIYTALVNARTHLKDNLAELGSCDHAVGICACHLIATIEEVDRALKDAEQYVH